MPRLTKTERKREAAKRAAMVEGQPFAEYSRAQETIILLSETEFLDRLSDYAGHVRDCGPAEASTAEDWLADLKRFLDENE